MGRIRNWKKKQDFRAKKQYENGTYTKGQPAVWENTVTGSTLQIDREQGGSFQESVYRIRVTRGGHKPGSLLDKTIRGPYDDARKYAVKWMENNPAPR